MNPPVLSALFGCLTYFLFRKQKYQDKYINVIEDFLSWFPDFVSSGIANLLINDVMMVIYIILAGFMGLCLDVAFSD